MAKTAKKRARKARASRTSSRPRVYHEPHTAAELGIRCAACGDHAQWFDPERAKHDHRAGFICGKESRSIRSQKLLIRN